MHTHPHFKMFVYCYDCFHTHYQNIKAGSQHVKKRKEKKNRVKGKKEKKMKRRRQSNK